MVSVALAEGAAELRMSPTCQGTGTELQAECGAQGVLGFSAPASASTAHPLPRGPPFAPTPGCCSGPGRGRSPPQSPAGEDVPARLLRRRRLDQPPHPCRDAGEREQTLAPVTPARSLPVHQQEPGGQVGPPGHPQLRTSLSVKIWMKSRREKEPVCSISSPVSSTQGPANTSSLCCDTSVMRFRS